MKINLALLPLLVLTVMVCSGCWDIKDIKNMQVANAEAVDTAGENGYIREALLVSGKNWGTKSFAIASGSGKLYTYALTDIQAKTGGTYLFTGIETFIVGKKLAERGLRDLIEATVSSPQLAYTIDWVISDGPASEIMHINNPAYPNTGEYIQRLLHAAPDTLFIPRSTTFNVGSNMHAETCSMLPVVKKDESNNLIITGASLIDVDKLRVILNREDAQMVSLLRGEKVRGRLYIRGQVGDEMEDMVIKTTRFSRKVKVSKKGGRYEFKIIIHLQGDVHEDIPSRNFISEKQFFAQAERAASRSIQNRCLRLAEKMQQEWKFDAFNLGKYAHARYSDLPKGQNWGGIVPLSKIDVEIHTHLAGDGEAY
ncbi:MAG: Ger(x)C family spore germination protein [Methylocystaceae bacterium]